MTRCLMVLGKKLFLIPLMAFCLLQTEAKANVIPERVLQDLIFNSALLHRQMDRLLRLSGNPQAFLGRTMTRLATAPAPIRRAAQEAYITQTQIVGANYP